MANLTNAQKKEWAKVLYVNENLSQVEISEKVGVSKVTINKWVKNENWDTLKKSMLITRESQLNRLYSQLDELNTHILNRPKGERFANSKEADTIGKLTSAIKTLETEASIADIVEVSKRQLSWLRAFNPEKAREFGILMNEFIKDTLAK